MLRPNRKIWVYAPFFRDGSHLKLAQVAMGHRETLNRTWREDRKLLLPVATLRGGTSP
jgi:hypothetical protein